MKPSGALVFEHDDMNMILESQKAALQPESAMVENITVAAGPLPKA
jgi:hypothetical protein